MRKALSCALLWGFFIFPSESKLVAETPTGKIEVHAKDRGGDFVVGAKVTATGDSGREGSCDTSDKDGSCLISELPGGSYAVEVAARGFKTVVHKGVVVNVSYTTKLAVSLEAGAVSETIEVTGESPIVSTDSNNASTIAQLPLNGRQFTELTLLSPGVTATFSLSTAADNSNYELGRVWPQPNGNRPHSSSYRMDGTLANDLYSNTPVHVSDGSLSEISILASPNPEFGGNPGAIQAATTSGSNAFHASVREQIRNDVLDARDYFNLSGRRNKLRYNYFGGRFGGPLKSDKVFWFISYEGQRDALETSTLLAVPTSSDFAEAIQNLGGDPAIPPQENPVVNPVVRNLFSLCASSSQCPGGSNLWPSPAPELAGDVVNSAPHASTYHRFDIAFARLDFNATLNDHFSGYYTFNDGRGVSPVAVAGSGPLPQINTRSHFHTHLATFSYARTFSPRVLNNLRLAAVHYSTNSLDNNDAGIDDPNRTIGLNTAVANSRDFGLPQLRVRGFAFLGASPYANPQGRQETNWQIEDQLVWNNGLHSLKLGYEFRRGIIRSFNDVNYRGLLEFDSLQDFLAGKIAQGSISKGESDRVTSSDSHAAYAQDSFRVSRHVTLDFGLRWEYFGPLDESHSLLSKYDPSRGLINSATIYHPDFSNFAPRLGLSWDVTGAGKTVLRLSAGRFFSAIPQNLFVGQVQFNSLIPGVAYNAIPERPILASHSPVNVLQVGVPVFPAASFASDTRDAFTLSDISTPCVFSYNVNVQREVFNRAAVQITYSGSQGHKLPRVRDINAPVVPGGIRPFSTAAVLSTVAPNTPFIVNQLEASANSNFNSLQLSFRQSGPWHGWQTWAFWTWAHSIDNASDGLDWTPNLTLPNNSQSPNGERASSAFDQRHSFLLQSNYEFPYRGTNRWRTGWRVSAGLALRSGQPYHVNFAEEFDTQGAYDFILRPDVVGDPFLGTSLPYRLLNLAAFQVPCTLDGFGTTVSHCVAGTLHFGNLPRNAFVGPGLGKFDLAIAKATRFGERWTLELRAEALNLTNHPIFASPLLPRFIAPAGLEGISSSGRGGAAGVACDSVRASINCYLPLTATPDGAANAPSGVAGARTVQVSAKLSF